ncbi:MAG: hypothetical protein ABW019_00030 [Chitinophagaceae bacterium]
MMLRTRYYLFVCGIGIKNHRHHPSTPPYRTFRFDPPANDMTTGRFA